MILYLTAGLFGGYNETIKFEELGISTHSLTRRLTRTLSFHPDQYGISTHSLTRRLTNSTLSDVGFWIISTHSLTRRLTGDPGKELCGGDDFNSQPHKEADCF